MKFYRVVILVVILIATHCQTKKDRLGLSNIGLNFRPNILWLSTEDIGCYLSAYGDSTIITPNLDRLAAEGIVFENAFAVAGACAPSRFSIISGIFPTSTSANNMRTWGRKLPDSTMYFTEYLMRAGYYCVNNSKTDYAFTEPKHETLWHEASINAHYKKRPEGRPFFAVFNYTSTHESRLFNSKNSVLVDLDSVSIPPYYVDSKTIRKDLALNYSNILQLDDWIGNKLLELDEAGLSDSTIVFFWSDHGGPFPNQKREIYDRGTKVPLLIKFPNHLMAGRQINSMVSLMDLGPTAMSLAGIPKPSYMHGDPFLGMYKSNSNMYVYAARDRIAAQYDVRRTVRDHKYRYVKNYYPEFPRYQHLNYRMDIDMMIELLDKHQNNKLNEVQEIWFERSKPMEELYDLDVDRHEVNNLVDDPEYTLVLNRLRKAHERQMIEYKDVGLIPEPMIFKLQDSLEMPIYSIVRKYDFPLQKIQHVATAWTRRDYDLDEIASYLNDSMPVLRYWSAVGLGNLGDPAKKYTRQLFIRLKDEFASVRIAAAFSLYQLGETEPAVESLIHELKVDQITVRIFAAFQLARIGPPALSSADYLIKLIDGNVHTYVRQAAENALREIKRKDVI